MDKKLTAKQQSYYDERVQFFSSMRVAVPHGLIYDKAKTMSDEECDKWLGITKKEVSNG